MISLGNDIVDLNDSDADIQSIHPRFIERALNDQELLDIRDKTSQITKEILWTYWAAKESAYKALKRLIPKIPFTYKKFSYNPLSNKVAYEQYELECEIDNDPNYVHAVSYASRDSSFTFGSSFISNIKKKSITKKKSLLIKVFIFKKMIHPCLSFY